ncbi:MAG TPA: ATP-binding cassette domain-containing protein [Candidatus Fimimorpha faecalis]|uniref:ATP-binding cassette domain-containing protein n=1 Tax=Candidatus Fimimorpha faecalis TaxID=2840824 RepID=A0A9D1JDQ9_9FIRM|nr:ATP-binding cassette domain-containing protein [Candidatus Fimimorpha faecalis]
MSLSKKYQGKNAVDHVTMTVKQGAIYGFIGRNGAGKSTTLKMLCGLAKPTSGDIQIFGTTLQNTVTRKRIGMLIEQAGIYPNFTAYENMKLKANYLGVIDPDLKIRELLALFHLEEQKKKKIKQFSMGMKQRLGIAMALLGNPDLLILDEPINGLDPEGILEIRQMLKRFNEENRITMIISSHILGELSKIATDYGIIKDGKLIEQISAKELEAKCNDYIHLKTPDTKRAVVALEEKLGIRHYEIRPDGEIRIYERNNQVSKVLLEQGIVVEELFRHQQDLERYFLELMGGE